MIYYVFEVTEVRGDVFMMVMMDMAVPNLDGKTDKGHGSEWRAKDFADKLTRENQGGTYVVVQFDPRRTYVG